MACWAKRELQSQEVKRSSRGRRTWKSRRIAHGICEQRCGASHRRSGKRRLGILSSILGPLAGGFGSLLAGALPVVGVISSIIAVVSILGDNLEGIRTIVGNVFGEPGLAVFDRFTGALSKVGDFISSLFVDGGVATALSGFRDMLFGQNGVFAGDSLGAGAFDGVVGILQSIMTVVGQLVNFLQRR